MKENNSLLKKIQKNVSCALNGRYGMDESGQAIYVLGILVYIAGLAWNNRILFVFSFLILLVSIWRMLSRNIEARSKENQRFLTLRWKLISRIKGRRKGKDRKNYLYFKCPECGQNLRVPRGKGKIEVTCPHCKKVFDKRS